MSNEKIEGDISPPKSAMSEMDRRLQQAEVLLEVSSRLAAAENLDDVMEVVIDITMRAMGPDRVVLFINDPDSGELHSQNVVDNVKHEIRIPNTSGVAGHVFQSGKGVVVHDAYRNKHFNAQVDKLTGYRTRSILCAPIRTGKGDVIGVTQALNKKRGKFTRDDLNLMEFMGAQAAASLRSTLSIEQMKKSRLKELELLEVASKLNSEINLGTLLRKVMGQVSSMLNAQRSTLFLNDEKTGELWSEVGEGLDATEIRLPNHTGIAGTVFRTGESVNIPHAYADLRFNPDFDRRTNFFTRSILCVPVVNMKGNKIGVTQVLNKRGCPFDTEDERRLKAFTAQISIGLENAKMVADIQRMKNYNESMLESMSNGVITIDEDGRLATCNKAGLAILRGTADEILGCHIKDFFAGVNAWLLEKIEQVEKAQSSENIMDAVLHFDGDDLSVNVTVLPFLSADHKKIGSMLMVEDISYEKRVKSTMARYMDPSLADKLLSGGDDILGGQSVSATVLFSDIRGFTTLTEELGPQGTVKLLNDYFTIMVDCIRRHDGMLDKFIGDALMAAFGIPIAHGDDEDRCVRAAIDMITDLGAWNQKRALNGLAAIDMGIGINTDTVVSGNIGSPKRMDYTMIGDGVNLAARLESACKQYNARILISEHTYRKLRGTYRIREVDRVVVKGKTKSISVFEILDYHNDVTFPHIIEVLAHFRNGISRYRARNWQKAIESFQEALALNPRDRLCEIYIERCEYIKDHEPDDDWDGVWVMDAK